MKKILVCFDGTGNEPEDAEQEVDDSGEVADQNISNVLKLHLRAGGHLGQAAESNGQLSLYYPGPGTRGGVLRRAVESAVAPRSLDKIKERALTDLRAVYEPGDEISVFGFSRGAAIARRFVAHLQSFGSAQDEKGALAGTAIPVAFVGVWDTVLSAGVPEKNLDERSTGLLGEATGIGDSVGRVLHLVSIDDPRKVFTPTLFQPDDRVTELWFAGVHSDIGGGYRKAGLSDITLGFMLHSAATEAGLDFMAPEDVDLSAAVQMHGKAVEIGPDDLTFKPDAAGADHVRTFDSFLKDAADAIANRNVMALGGRVPILHDSVVKRGRRVSSYRPRNLRNTPHSVYGDSSVYGSFAEHFSGDR